MFIYKLGFVLKISILLCYLNPSLKIRKMKTILVVFICCVISACTTDLKVSEEDELEIQAIIKKLDDAWNNGNGKAWAINYTQDGEFMNINGKIFEGQSAIEIHHTEILLTTFKKSKAESNIRRIRRLDQNAVIVDTDFYLRDFEKLTKRLYRIFPDGSMRHRLKHILVKQENRWLIASSQNTPNLP